MRKGKSSFSGIQNRIIKQEDYVHVLKRFSPDARVAIISVLAVGLLMVLVVIFLLKPLFSGLQGIAVVEDSKQIPGEKGTGDNDIAGFFSPQVRQWGDQIESWAKEWNLDANLVATVMQIESCGNPYALSSAGAKGLFQVMPFHFMADEDGFDPQTNAKRGLAYLSEAYRARQGEVRGTLASYNGGIYGASQPETLWDNEMQRYAYWGSGIYQDAKNGMKDSPVLQEWLAAGGASLCNQAAVSMVNPQ